MVPRRSNRKSSNAIGTFILGGCFGAIIVGLAIFLLADQFNLELKEPGVNDSNLVHGSSNERQNQQRSIVINLSESRSIFEKTLEDEAMIQMRLFQKELKFYRAHIGTYPPTEAGLSALIIKPLGVPQELWKGPYCLEMQLPVDPWDREYLYSSNKESFTIVSLGEDGLEGTGDDIVLNGK